MSRNDSRETDPLEEKLQTRRYWEASAEITRAWRMITDKNGNPDSLSPTVSFLKVTESEKHSEISISIVSRPFV